MGHKNIFQHHLYIYAQKIAKKGWMLFMIKYPSSLIALSKS